MAWTAVDQALSSVTNFGVGIVVARAVSASDFGAFGIAFTTYLLIVGISRSLCTDPLLIRFSSENAAGRRLAVREASGAALALSLPMAALCAASAVAGGGTLATTLLVLAAFVPGLLVQDSMRFAFFTLGQPAKATANDAFWLLFQLVAFSGLFMFADPTPATLLAAWGAAATAAAIVGPFQADIRPSPRRAVAWVRTHADLGGRYLLDFFAIVGSVQLTIYGLAFSRGLSEAGSFRAAQLLLGPLNMLFIAALTTAVPEGVRMRERADGDLRTMCRLLAVFLPVVALPWVVALVVTPDRIGQAVLGPTWAGASRVVLPLGLATAVTGVLFAASSGLRALANARRALRARLLMLPLTLVGGLGGALFAGAGGSAVGLLGANSIGGAIWWVQFSRAAAEATPPARQRAQ